MYLVHSRAEDLINPLSSGDKVVGFAQFYTGAAGWKKIRPGELGLADLWGGASGFPNQEKSIQPSVEFYIGTDPDVIDSFVAVNGDTSDTHVFGFFGRRTR